MQNSKIERGTEGKGTKTSKEYNTSNEDEAEDKKNKRHIVHYC